MPRWQGARRSPRPTLLEESKEDHHLFLGRLFLQDRSEVVGDGLTIYAQGGFRRHVGSPDTDLEGHQSCRHCALRRILLWLSQAPVAPKRKVLHIPNSRRTISKCSGIADSPDTIVVPPLRRASVHPGAKFHSLVPARARKYLVALSEGSISAHLLRCCCVLGNPNTWTERSRSSTSCRRTCRSEQGLYVATDNNAREHPETQRAHAAHHRPT